MNHFLIITNKHKDTNLNITDKICNHLAQSGAIYYLFDQYSKYTTTRIDVPEDTECILVIGGDGTILNAASLLIGKNIPLLGINLGTLGFLAEVNIADLAKTLDLLLKDNYQIENRVMLKGEVIREGECIAEYKALNDFVISRSGYSSVVGLTVMINETEIESYFADGLVICTPTGSTAYNLAAGGPILNPTCKNFVVTPICPHSLTVRSVVLAKEDIIKIRLQEQSEGRTKTNPALLYDGNKGEILLPGDEVKIYKAKEVTPFIKTREVSFAKILKEKMC